MPKPAVPALSFERLVTAIGQAHAELAAQASRAVNVRLTLRNCSSVVTSPSTNSKARIVPSMVTSSSNGCRSD